MDNNNNNNNQNNNSRDINEQLDKLIGSYRAAADELEFLKNKSPEEIKSSVQDIGGGMSCCGTCTLISFIPPCTNTCIAVSPLF